MRKLKEDDEVKKPRLIRLTDKTWEKFSNLKSREQTWESFLNELEDLIGKIKNLGN